MGLCINSYTTCKLRQVISFFLFFTFKMKFIVFFSERIVLKLKYKTSLSDKVLLWHENRDS